MMFIVSAVILIFVVMLIIKGIKDRMTIPRENMRKEVEQLEKK